MRGNVMLRPGRTVALTAFAVVVFATVASAQNGGNPNPGLVIPPESGQYPDLSARWWQWALGTPATVIDPTTSPQTNPLLDTTGAAAYNGQPADGNVFFLAGLITFNSGLTASVERTITIHPGTRLFFPILNSEADNVGVVPPLTVDQLRAQAAFFAEQVTSLYVTIDGVSLQGLNQYRVISPVFTFILPPNNIAGNSVNLYYLLTGGAINVSGPIYPAVGDGFYVLLNPLKPGHHVIKFGGTTKTLDANGNPATFKLDITYNITVSPK